jgi:hypothetical protein
MNLKPNFFNYATNELSQDAFFCWLIEWSLEDYKNESNDLHKISMNFLKELVPEEFSNDFIVKTCCIHRQRKNTDFIIEINRSIIIHFEDKIKSNTSYKQLSKYKIELQKLYKNHRIYHIYLKTDLVWEKERNLTSENGYKPIDLFTVEKLLKGKSNSDIFNDYITNIQRRVLEYKNYKKISPKKWNNNQWLGFIYDLSQQIKYFNFDKHYVGNDFWFVFSWRKLNNFKDSHVSFELINKKCAIKTHVYDKSTSKERVLDYVKKLLTPYYKSYKTKNYNRTGKSVLAIEFVDFIVMNNNELIDFQKTKEKLVNIKKIFDEKMNNVG